MSKIKQYINRSILMKSLTALLLIMIGFIIGLLWTVEASFNTGYKIAYREIEILLEDGINGQFDFYISGLPYKFRPQADKKALKIKRSKEGETGESKSNLR